MIIGTKVLVGIGLAGAGIAGLGIGGHMLFSKKTTQTIRDKITGKTLLAYYVKAEPEDSEAKKPWSDKVSSYSSDTSDTDKEKILVKTGIDETKLSEKCREILETPLNPVPEDLDKKVQWATKWCFSS